MSCFGWELTILRPDCYFLFITQCYFEILIFCDLASFNQISVKTIIYLLIQIFIKTIGVDGAYGAQVVRIGRGGRIGEKQGNRGDIN